MTTIYHTLDKIDKAFLFFLISIYRSRLRFYSFIQTPAPSSASSNSIQSKFESLKKMRSGAELNIYSWRPKFDQDNAFLLCGMAWHGGFGLVRFVSVVSAAIIKVLNILYLFILFFWSFFLFFSFGVFFFTYLLQHFILESTNTQTHTHTTQMEEGSCPDSTKDCPLPRLDLRAPI